MKLNRLAVALLTGAVASLPVFASGAVALSDPHPRVVSADPVNTTPHALNGAVKAIATVGNTVYVGGTFTTVTNAGSATQMTRNHLFAYDRSTGAVLPFAPALNGAVDSIAPAPGGQGIIIGGRFTTVGGAAQRSLAMLTPAGARVPTFTARTNGYVEKVLVRGSRLVAGGRFSTANGTSRANLAAFDAGTGTLDGLNLRVAQGRTKSDGTVTTAGVLEMDADPAGRRLVIVGNFRQVDGQVRQQIAMIDLGTRTLLPWSTNRFPNDASASPQAFQCYQVFDTQMRDVEFAPDGSYFVVVTTGGAPDFNRVSLCDTTTRWESRAVTTGAEVETWKNCTGGDTLLSVAVTGAAVYVGGHQRWLDNCGGRDSAVAGSFAASGIGAIDPASGRAIKTWNPGRTRGVGAEELVGKSEGLYIGSDTDRLAGEYHARLGFFPL